MSYNEIGLSAMRGEMAVYPTNTGENPILQAKLLNKEKTDLNIVMGLCVGHDSLFYKYSDALVTTAVAKARVLGHNPVAALYTADSYYAKLRRKSMSYEIVKRYFEEVGLGERVKNLSHTSGTVEQAAEAIGCEPKQIAKTMSFLVNDMPVLIVTAGDAKVDNKKYKAFFHQKAKLIPGDQVEPYIGHAPGGVCPFATHEGVKVYLDISLKRFSKVYPAGGNDHSAVDLSLDELEIYANSSGWVDVCKEWFVNG